MADYRALGRSSRATLRTTTLLFAALIPFISASSASPNAAAKADRVAANAEALLLLPSGGAIGLSLAHTLKDQGAGEILKEIFDTVRPEA